MNYQFNHFLPVDYGVLKKTGIQTLMRLSLGLTQGPDH